MEYVHQNPQNGNDKCHVLDNNIKVQRALEALKSYFFKFLAFCLACDNRLLSRLCFNRREKSFFSRRVKKRKPEKESALASYFYLLFLSFLGFPNVPFFDKRNKALFILISFPSKPCKEFSKSVGRFGVIYHSEANLKTGSMRKNQCIY